MSTQAQTNANRRNAQASTGPSTPEGKAASSRNATSHGLATSYFSLLPGEDPHAYADTLERYTALFCPSDCHELHLVETMVQSKWKLLRIQLMEAALVTQMMAAEPKHQTPAEAIAAALLAGTAGPYKTLQRYQAAAARSYDKAAAQLIAYGIQRPLPKTTQQQQAQPQPQPEKPPVPNEPNPETKAWAAETASQWPAAFAAYKASGKDLIADLVRQGIVSKQQAAAA